MLIELRDREVALLLTSLETAASRPHITEERLHDYRELAKKLRSVSDKEAASMPVPKDQGINPYAWLNKHTGYMPAGRVAWECVLELRAKWRNSLDVDSAILLHELEWHVIPLLSPADREAIRKL